MRRNRSALIAVVCVLGLQGLVFAGGVSFNSVQNGDWSDPDTWGGSVPTSLADDEVHIHHIVAVTTTGTNAKFISLGNSGPGTLNISSGDVTTNFFTQLGSNNTGTVNLSGGTLTTPTLTVGFLRAGTFNMSGGSLVAGNVSLPSNVPGGDPSSFVLSGGTMTLSGTMTIGASANNISGTLTIESPAGTFEGTTGGIDGTVHFTSQSTLVIRPAGPASAYLTRINVGAVNIDTGATLELDPLYTPQVGDNWDLFISQAVVGGSSGIFTNVVTPTGVTISQSVAPTRGVPVGPEKLTVTVTAVPTPVAWVDFGWDQAEDGSESNPWNSLTEGLANVSAGGIVNIKGDTGTSATIETPTINQDVTLVAPSGTVFIGLSKGRAAGDSSQSGFVSRGNKRE